MTGLVLTSVENLQLKSLVCLGFQLWFLIECIISNFRVSGFAGKDPQTPSGRSPSTQGYSCMHYCWIISPALVSIICWLNEQEECSCCRVSTQNRLCATRGSQVGKGKMSLSTKFVNKSCSNLPMLCLLILSQLVFMLFSLLAIMHNF